jgi:putative tryptophan/tyrosine transport system substrate-binding protein
MNGAHHKINLSVRTRTLWLKLCQITVKIGGLLTMSIAFRRLAGLALAFALLGTPPAIAQRATPYRLGVLIQGSPPVPGSRPTSVSRSLRELGYIDGQNLIIDRRFADGDPARFDALVTELVALRPDVILADTTPGALAAKRATTTIPIVMINVTDPVATGLVASLSRPGGNVTGVADLGVETAVKGLDLMHAAVPNATRIAILMSDNPAQVFQLHALQAAAKTAGLTLVPMVATSFEEFDSVFASMTSKKAGAVIVLGGVLFSTPRQRARLAELAAQAKLPMLAQDSQSVASGALMGYGPAPPGRYAVHYIDKILKGAKPSELPVQQPTEFDLVINLKTAKVLGLTMPQSVLLRATEIIQ